MPFRWFQPSSAAASATVPAAAPTAGVGVQDIDRWQRSMAAEKTAVLEAGARVAAARDDQTKTEALFAATDIVTAEAGARAAGLDLETYRRISQALSAAAAQFSPVELEMDVSQMLSAAVEQMKQAREAGRRAGRQATAG